MNSEVDRCVGRGGYFQGSRRVGRQCVSCLAFRVFFPGRLPSGGHGSSERGPLKPGFLVLGGKCSVDGQRLFVIRATSGKLRGKGATREHWQGKGRRTHARTPADNRHTASSPFRVRGCGWRFSVCLCSRVSISRIIPGLELPSRRTEHSLKDQPTALCARRGSMRRPVVSTAKALAFFLAFAFRTRPGRGTQTRICHDRWDVSKLEAWTAESPQKTEQ